MKSPGRNDTERDETRHSQDHGDDYAPSIRVGPSPGGGPRVVIGRIAPQQIALRITSGSSSAGQLQPKPQRDARDNASRRPHFL